MNLPDDLAAVAFALADRDIRARRRGRAHIPYELQRLHDYLTLSDRCSTEPATAPDPIGVREAADILGTSVQWVRRIAADLDGRRVGRDWIFQRSTVEEYAEARTTK